MFFNLGVGCSVFHVPIWVWDTAQRVKEQKPWNTNMFFEICYVCFWCVLVRKQGFQSCFKIKPPWLRYLSTLACCKRTTWWAERNQKKQQRKKRIWFGGTFFNLKICNDFSFESPFSWMLVRPDRWWACVGLLHRRRLTRGAFGKLICSNILSCLTYIYIYMAMAIHES